MALYEAWEFYNPTDEQYVGKYDGESYIIEPKKSISVAKFVAEHFAKHLATLILQKRFGTICTDHPVMTESIRKTCGKCAEKAKKLEAINSCEERQKLYDVILRKTVKSDTEPENKDDGNILSQ